jgi:Ulp1 family protease
LDHERWFNDELIDSYGELVSDFSFRVAKGIKVLVIPTTRVRHIESLMKTPGDSAQVNAFSFAFRDGVINKVAKYTQLNPSTEADLMLDNLLVIAPINQNKHWYMLVANLNQGTITIVDSMLGASLATRREGVPVVAFKKFITVGI